MHKIKKPKQTKKSSSSRYLLAPLVAGIITATALLYTKETKEMAMVETPSPNTTVIVGPEQEIKSKSPKTVKILGREIPQEEIKKKSILKMGNSFFLNQAQLF